MPSTRCNVILVHGVGNQSKDWSKPFREALNQALGADAARVKLIDAYWAPQSKLSDLLRPRLAFGGEGVQTSLEDELYARAERDFAAALGQAAAPRAAARAFGPGDVWDWIKDKFDGGKELVADSANYVSRNGVRTAIQNVLHGRLGEAHRGGAPAIVVAHSLGTIISYDVLRQAGANYPGLRTWITMGSPLKWFFDVFQWGKQPIGMSPGIRWVNLYDKRDLAGKALKGTVDWASPQPVDRAVDNVKNAGNAHNHWRNREVVAHVADEVRRVLA
jgi:pimeloyl-ACP methyl ester carboxylesterase